MPLPCENGLEPADLLNRAQIFAPGVWREAVLGVLAEASGKGVGTDLLEEAKRWATARGLHRIELNVMARNHRAIALYERAGFVHEGRRADCLLIDGKFLDELYMAMILPGSSSP